MNQLLFGKNTHLAANSEEKLSRLVSAYGKMCHRMKSKINVGKALGDEV